MELLNEASLRQMVDEQRWDEIIGRIDFVVRTAALSCPNAPDLSELVPLHQADLNKAAFCASMMDLMFGDGDGPSRLQRYADAAENNHFPTGWGMPTLFLMLMDPFTDCFIKPEAMAWFLGFAGLSLELNQLSGETYKRMTSWRARWRFNLKDGNMVEMPVIQRLIWVCFLEEKGEG